MRGYGFVFVVFLLVFVMSGAFVNAAPPPEEVEKRKAEAPVHVIGTVVEEKFFRDTTRDQDHPEQTRVMTLEVKQMIKAPRETMSMNQIEVYYHYIPSWRSHEYVGGERMDIAVGDVIEIWLTKGQNGWESALWGNTMEHIEYAADRSEPISEPFFHAVNRNTSVFFKKHTSMAVLCVLFLILILMAAKAFKKGIVHQ